MGGLRWKLQLEQSKCCPLYFNSNCTL